jgi:cyclophilin family peptidyl-prolyl cis-trans isomerase
MMGIGRLESVMNWMRSLLLMAAGWFCICAEVKAVPTTNGLYAAIATTKGTFYCYLRYDLTPRTVANFVTLANGTKDWVDWPKGTVVKKPFYNGSTFHRVIAGFMIQGGSPNGSGTDGPGYMFRDEFVPSLKHDKPGVLSMANSGTNSNGSQFFVTVSPQPQLNNVHSVFGQVVEGMNVVSNINTVATGPGDKPVVPVVITNVTILKIGTAANNFNPAAVTPALPVPKLKQAYMGFFGPDMAMYWYQLAGYEYTMLYSPDTTNWTSLYVGTFGGRYMNDFRAFFPSQFFRVVEAKID